eukprot:COSAG02_NODE_144_length_34086_cov_65.390944_8_plen_92_part_00
MLGWTVSQGRQLAWFIKQELGALDDFVQLVEVALQAHTMLDDLGDLPSDEKRIHVRSILHRALHRATPSLEVGTFAPASVTTSTPHQWQQQ